MQHQSISSLLHPSNQRSSEGETLYSTHDSDETWVSSDPELRLGGHLGDRAVRTWKHQHHTPHGNKAGKHVMSGNYKVLSCKPVQHDQHLYDNVSFLAQRITQKTAARSAVAVPRRLEILRNRVSVMFTPQWFQDLADIEGKKKK